MATSYKDYTGNQGSGSSSNEYAFTFPSLAVTDVQVEVDNVIYTNASSGSTTYQITGYNSTSGGTVVFNSGSIPTLSTQKIRIYRDTDVSTASGEYQPKHTYSAGSSVKAGDLNTNQKQALYAVHEAKERPIGTPEIESVAVTTAKIAADAIDGTKIADDAVGAEHIEVLDANLQLADNAKIQVGTGNDLEIYHDGSNSWIKNGTGAFVTRADDIRLQNNDGSDAMLELTSNGSVAAYHNGNKKLETSATGITVTGETKTTTLEIGGADVTSTAAELNILDGVTSNASELNKLDGVTASTADLNIVASMTKQTTISDSDSSYPTSGAVVDYVAAQIAPIGGLEVIADDESFPETQPAAGVVISIADAGGLVVNGSGVSTTGDTITSNATVTINGINSAFYNKTVDAGVSFMVSSTGSGQIYNFHKATLKEADILSLSNDINDFAARYRVYAGEPSSNNDEGDLVYDTNADKMKVYDTATSAWKEVTSTGDFKYLFLCPAGGTGAPTINGSIATYDLRETSNSGSSASVTSAAQLIVSIDGIIQKPNTGTSAPSEGFALVDANTIIFGTNLPTGSEVFITQIGSAVTVPTPGDNTVTSAKIVDGTIVNGDISSSAAIAGSKLADDSITEAKLDIHNAPSGTDKYLKYTSNGMEWATAAATDATKMPLAGGTFTGDVIWDNSTNAGRDVTWDESEDLWQFNDNIRTQWGSGATGLDIYHNGTNGHLRSKGGGNIEIGASADSGINYETAFKYVPDNQVELYFNNFKKFETTNTGATVTGTVIADGLTLGDSEKIKLGNSDDLQIYHDGTNTQIANTTGSLIISDPTNTMYLQSDVGIRLTDVNGNENFLIANDNGSVDLFYDNTKKFETTSGGCTVTGTATVGGLYLEDDNNIKVGTGDDLKIYHNGTNSFIDNDQGSLIIKQDAGGFIYLQATHIFIESEDGEKQADFVSDGAVKLFYDGSQKFETISSGVGIGTSSSTPNPGVSLATAGTVGIGNTDGTSGQSYIEFRRNTTQIGSVTQSGTTGVSFNTSSDYRLKENQVAISDGITRLKTLKPYRFNWKAEPSITVDGFFAHEVTAVPEAIVGTKDKVDEDDKPIYQQIDQSKLVPLLTAALQEAIIKIETLETKVAALEAK